MSALFAIIDKLTNALKWIALFILFLVMICITVGVIFRLLGSPLKGSVEIVEILQFVLIMFAVVYAQTQRGHIAVEFVAEYFPKNVQSYLEPIGYLLTFIVCLIISYVFFNGALHNLFDSPRTTLLLRVPFYALKFVAALGFLAWGLASVKQLIQIFQKSR